MTLPIYRGVKDLVLIELLASIHERESKIFLQGITGLEKIVV